jgi:hypothetical protein
MQQGNDAQCNHPVRAHPLVSVSHGRCETPETKKQGNADGFSLPSALNGPSPGISLKRNARGAATGLSRIRDRKVAAQPLNFSNITLCCSAAKCLLGCHGAQFSTAVAARRPAA